MPNVLELFKEFLNPFAWFLSLGKGDIDHVKSEIADLLHHSSQSLRSLLELSQTLEDIPRSDFSKERFGPIANHCWWFFTTDRGLQKARTHCTDIQRDVARIKFKMAKILRTENQNWKGINDAFGRIMDADRVYLHNYEDELSRIGGELSAIDELLKKGATDAAWQRYGDLRSSLTQSRQSLSNEIAQMQKAQIHIHELLT